MPLIAGFTRSESVRNTVRYMIPQDHLFSLMQRGAHRIDLRQHVDAIPVFLDHTQQTTNLAFDPLEPFEDVRLGSAMHGRHSLIQYPRGVYRMDTERCHGFSV
jgi:hypothetical protein